MLGFRPGLILRLFARTASVQRKRAVLTIAAIAWGTLSLLLLLSFGEGLRIQLHRASRGMGSSLAVMWPGETGRPWQGLPAGRRIRPRIEDLDLLRERVTNHAGVTGEISNWQVTMTTPVATVTDASYVCSTSSSTLTVGRSVWPDIGWCAFASTADTIPETVPGSDFSRTFTVTEAGHKGVLAVSKTSSLSRARARATRSKRLGEDSTSR